MRVLICGDRNWTDAESIEKYLLALAISVNEMHPGERLTVIHGAARGADHLAGDVAAKHQMACVSYPADWTTHGRAAGPIRNQQMLAEGKPDLVLAFHDDIDNSKGTKDMVNRARRAGIGVRLLSHRDLDQSRRSEEG